MFAKTSFAEQDKLIALIDRLADEVTYEEALKEVDSDPALALGRSVNTKAMECQQAIMPYQGQYARGHRNFIAGMMEMKKDEALYPDANFSMRLTYGNVLTYRPRDGVIYDYYTTLTGVMEKEDRTTGICGTGKLNNYTNPKITVLTLLRVKKWLRVSLPTPILPVATPDLRAERRWRTSWPGF